MQLQKLGLGGRPDKIDLDLSRDQDYALGFHAANDAGAILMEQYSSSGSHWLLELRFDSDSSLMLRLVDDWPRLLERAVGLFLMISPDYLDTVLPPRLLFITVNLDATNYCFTDTLEASDEKTESTTDDEMTDCGPNIKPTSLIAYHPEETQSHDVADTHNDHEQSARL